MRQCNGICKRYKFKGKGAYGSKWYVPGVKRCRVCYIFIVYDKVTCPCCGSKLSTRPSQGRKDIKPVGDDDNA